MRFNPLYTVLSLMLLAFLLSFSSLRRSRGRLKSIQIALGDTARGHFVQSAEVAEDLRKAGIAQHVLLREVNLEKIEAQLNRSPYVADAQVSLSVDGKLAVHLKQKSALVRVHSPRGDYYLSEKAEKMPLCKTYAPAVLLVQGVRADRDLKAVSTLAKALQKRRFLSRFIIGISSEKDGYLLHTRTGIHRILFGKAERIRKKLDKLMAFYKKVLNISGWKTCRLINLKYRNQVICSKS